MDEPRGSTPSLAALAQPAASSARAAARGPRLARYLPILDWLPKYRKDDLAGDLLAGAIVAIMLVPQGMAYALLAGLPPQMGLYSSILPLILYGLFGTSRYLCVGPTALVSLLVAAGIAPLAASESSLYAAFALTLALLTGVVRLLMGLLRVGFLLNVLSHPVLSGFTSAAALIICLTQLRHLLGVPVPSSGALHDLVAYTIRHVGETNPATLLIGLASIGTLLLFQYVLPAPLARTGLPQTVRQPITKSAPLLVVVLSTLVVAGLRLSESAGVKIVGAIPEGLPPLTVPALDWDIAQMLLPTALAISFVGYLEGISVAKSLASKRRQKVDVDQEMIALGAATLGAAFTGGYPVGGSFSRSVVAFIAGANTALATIFTALLLVLVVLFFTPLLYYLPLAALAAIIMVACINLVDFATLRNIWPYDRADAASWLVTFAAVFELGVMVGIVVGIITSLVLYLWRTSKPHVAIVGRVGNSEHFRNVRRWDVRTYPTVLAVRVDESLYFANARYVAELLRAWVADHQGVEHVVLICTAINYIDASALGTLEGLIEELRDAGVTFHLAEVKGPVMDRLQRANFMRCMGEGQVFISTHEAMRVLVGEPAPAVPAHEGI